MFQNFNKTDRRIVGIASFLVLLALYFLYDDSLLMSFDNNSNQPVLGELSNLENDVRYKYSKRFAWKTARSQEAVRLGDSIFTGKSSSAKIAFNDGRSLEIQPNSLVVITTVGDQMKLDLKFGSFGGTLDGCIKVDVKGKSVDVCGNKSKVEINAEGDVKVKEGSVKVADKKVEAAKPEVLAWTVKPDTDFYHSDHNRVMNAAWTAKKNYGRYRVQFSKDGKFKDSSTQDVTQDLFIETKNYPMKGEYWMRVQAEDAQGKNLASTDSIKVRFYDLIAPKILTPTVRQSFEIPTDEDGDPITEPKADITWTYPNGKAQFEMQLSQSEDFSTIIKKEVVPTQAYKTENLAPGKYYVRVKENLKDRPWSSVTPFEVKYQEGKELPPPELITKKINYSAPSPEAPVAKWESRAPAGKFIVETSTTPDFTPERTTTFEMSAKTATLKTSNPGRTYFRVSSVTKKGRRSPASEVGVLNTKIDRPILNPIAPYLAMAKTSTDQGGPIELPGSWTDLQIADSYEVQISEDAQFKEKTKLRVPTAESKLNIPRPGEYHWRVRGLNSEGKPITKFSDPGKINYDFKVPLAQPILVEPLANMTLFFQKKTSPYIWLEWKPVRQAKFYLIEVSKDPQFSSTVYQSKSTTARHLIKQNLGSGKLYWRAQAIGDDGRTSYWSPARQMTVWSGKQKTERVPASLRKQR